MTKKRIKALLLAVVMGITAVLFPGCSAAEAYRLVKVNSFEGEVSVQREEKLSAFEGLQLVSEDRVEVGNESLLELLADSDKHIVAEENTGFVIESEGTEENGSIRIDLLYGKSLFTIDNKLPDNSTFDVKTPNATLSVRGTSFSVAYDPEEETTEVEVFSGKVLVSYDDKELYLEKGESATISTKDGITGIISNSPSYNSSTATSATTTTTTAEETTVPETTTIETTTPETTTTTPETTVAETTVTAAATTAVTTVPETTTKKTTKKTTKATTITEKPVPTPDYNKRLHKIELNICYKAYPDSVKLYRNHFFTALYREDGGYEFVKETGIDYIAGYYSRESDLSKDLTFNTYYCRPIYDTNTDEIKTIFEKVTKYSDAHHDEIIAIYNKHKKDGFKTILENTEESKSLYHTYYPYKYVFDATDWFPETIQYEYTGSKYKLDIETVIANFSISLEKYEDDSSDSGDNYIITHPVTGDKVLVDSFMVSLEFYGDCRKVK